MVTYPKQKPVLFFVFLMLNEIKRQNSSATVKSESRIHWVLQFPTKSQLEFQTQFARSPMAKHTAAFKVGRAPHGGLSRFRLLAASSDHPQW